MYTPDWGMHVNSIQFNFNSKHFIHPIWGNCITLRQAREENKTRMDSMRRQGYKKILADSVVRFFFSRFSGQIWADALNHPVWVPTFGMSSLITRQVVWFAGWVVFSITSCPQVVLLVVRRLAQVCMHCQWPWLLSSECLFKCCPLITGSLSCQHYQWGMQSVFCLLITGSL